MRLVNCVRGSDSVISHLLVDSVESGSEIELSRQSVPNVPSAQVAESSEALQTVDLASDDEDRESQEALLLQRQIDRVSFSELLSGCGRFLTIGAPGYFELIL